MSKGDDRSVELREPMKELKFYPPSLSDGTGGFYAVVDSEGTLYRGFRAVSAKRLDRGKYDVVFNASVVRGAYVATVTCPNPLESCDPPDYFASVTSLEREGYPERVRVRTWRPRPDRGAQGGDPVDAGFHLVVLAA